MYTIGIIKATNLLEELFSSRQDNFFVQLIGLADVSSYNDTLALLNHKLSTKELGIIFDGCIPKPNDTELIQTILHELSSLSVGNYVNEDIYLLDDSSINTRLLQALDILIPLAIRNEHFTNPTIQNNFIAKIMIWCNIYINTLDFNLDTLPKCLFYGDIKRHEAYFLILLALTGLDVIYFNPNGTTILDNIDTDLLCQKQVLGNPPEHFISYMERVQNGVIIEKVTTYAKKATDELEQTLYHDTGIYKPWQFATGTTSPIMMDSVIEDLLTYWNEPSPLRPGFKTTGSTVHVPSFFTKINGVYRTLNEYYELIEKLKQAKKYLFFETPHITHITQGFKQTQPIQWHNMQRPISIPPASSFSQQDLYSLAFCLNPDQTIKREALKKHVLYQKILTMRIEFQNFILKKLEETFKATNTSLFEFEITDKERIRLMASLFTASDDLLNLLESFDFTSDIPKLILYINSREPFNQDDALLLGLLKTIGIDIVILSPNGANNIESVIDNKFITSIQLEDFAYDLPLRSSHKKNSFFNKLFK